MIVSQQLLAVIDHFKPSYSSYTSCSHIPSLLPSHTQGGYSLTLTIPESDRYYDDKCDILERNVGLGPTATFNIVRGEDPPQEMMAFLRLMQLQGE